MTIVPFQLRLALVISILLVSVGCDQATKKMAQTRLAPVDRIEVAGNFFTLQYAENRGAFLSLGAHLSDDARFWIFTVFTGGVLIALSYYVFASKTLHTLDIVAIALLLSGGVGNMIDRVTRNGHVVDFMVIEVWGPIRTGVFNVADMAVMAGVFLLFGARLLLRHQHDGETPHESANT